MGTILCWSQLSHQQPRCVTWCKCFKYFPSFWEYKHQYRKSSIMSLSALWNISVFKEHAYSLGGSGYKIFCTNIFFETVQQSRQIVLEVTLYTFTLGLNFVDGPIWPFVNKMLWISISLSFFLLLLGICKTVTTCEKFWFFDLCQWKSSFRKHRRVDSGEVSFFTRKLLVPG